MERSTKKRLSPPNSPAAALKASSQHQKQPAEGAQITRRKKREAPLLPGPKLFVAMSALLASILWTASVMLFSLQMDHGTFEDNRIMPSFKDRKATNPMKHSALSVELSALPPHELQLWPDDSAHPKLIDFLKACKGQDCHTKPTARETLILLVRPPGEFGAIVEDFVRAMVVNLNYQQFHTTFTVETYRHLPPAHVYSRDKASTKLIRVVTSPVLLEAIDLAMIVANSNKKNQFSWRDVTKTVRFLVQWQAEMNSLANEIPALLISLQSTLLVPQRNEEKLANFLLGNREENDDELGEHTIPRDDLAKRALQRVDACTEFLMSLDLADMNQSPLQIVQELVSQEINRPISRGPIASNAVMEQVHALLHHRDDVVCSSYRDLCHKRKVLLS